MGRAGRQPPPGGWRHGLPCHVVSQPIWKSRVKRLSLHGRRSACASPFFVLGTVKGSWMPSFEPQKVPFRREKGRFLVCKGRPCTVQKAWLGGTGTAWRRSGMWRLLSGLCFFFTFFYAINRPQSCPLPPGRGRLFAVPDGFVHDKKLSFLWPFRRFVLSLHMTLTKHSL